MSNKPHVIIIMADQLRLDAIGAHTPNLNKLREESVIFEKAYCASPLCVPARGSFFTGKYPNFTGSLINPWLEQEMQHGIVRPEHPNMYELMDDKWDSWHTGKQHLYTEPKLENDPNSKTHWRQLEGRYEAYLEEHGKKQPGGTKFKGIVAELAYGKTTRKTMYSTPATGRYEEGLDYFFDGFILQDSLEAIRQRDRSKPMLLNAMFLAPHPPLDIPEPWFSKVKEVELPNNVGKWSDNQSPLQLYNLPGIIGTKYSREEWEHIWKVYLGLVSLLDSCVGNIIDELKEQGMYEDSLIIFTSDHGEMLGSHCLWQKMCMYEESVRTPLFMKFPNHFKAKCTQIDDLVSSVDVLPTICDYLNIAPPENMSGVSLMPLITGGRLGRERIYIQFDGNGARSNFQRCVVEGNYKLIVDMFKDELFLELYDLEEDPQEMINLAFREDEHRERIEQLLDHLRIHMRETNDLLSVPVNVYQQFLDHFLEFIVEETGS